MSFLHLAIIGGAAVLAWVFLGEKDASAAPAGSGVKGLPGAAANVPRPGDDSTRITMTWPDGTTSRTHPAVSIAIHQAVASGDVTYMKNTAKQLKAFGWTAEAAKLEAIAKQVASGKAPSGTATPAIVTPQPSAPTALPPSILEKLQQIVVAQNPAQMRAFAATLRAAGFTESAASLEAAAAQVEAAAKTSTVRTPPALPQPTTTAPALPAPSVTPTITTPSVIKLPPMTVTPAPAPAVSPRRRAADILVKHLVVDNPPKKKEAKGLVESYQRLAGRSVDGLYGRGDAMSLNAPESGSHVPPTPRYWPKATYAKAIKEYESWLYERKALDSAREGEWSAAIATARRYYPS